ncbi:helix-turn-helix domain-containing protein [Listeria booriae]|uniref:helix-turn-helix domain-containing protein n=1 Tax=Listeria booriae TaxID=1552123 RepID=UPI00163D48CB|nr:helix-turn-helix transcriptional regulator [Listeria booriae]MBC1306810.1 helix-turn-helix transcriptional regulator [Listeria booriae]
MNIYSTIKEICELIEMPIKTLEEELGFARNSLYKWQTQSPSIDKVIKVADKLDLPLDYLIGRNFTDSGADEIRNLAFEANMRSYDALVDKLGELDLLLYLQTNEHDISICSLYARNKKYKFRAGEKLGELGFYTVLLNSAEFIKEIDLYGLENKREAEIKKILEIFQRA